MRSAQCADGLGLVADSIALWASQPREIAVSDLKLDGVFFFLLLIFETLFSLKKIYYSIHHIEYSDTYMQLKK